MEGRKDRWMRTEGGKEGQVDEDRGREGRTDGWTDRHVQHG